jgi:hypothetical protein
MDVKPVLGMPPGGPALLTKEHALLADIWTKPVYARLIAASLAREKVSWRLIGSPAETGFLSAPLRAAGVTAIVEDWGWDSPRGAEHLDEGQVLLVCKLPLATAEWARLHELQDAHPGRVRSLHELALPFTSIDLCLSLLPVMMVGSGTQFEEACRWYTGERLYWAFDALNAAFPLAGRRVIELGPLDGFETAGLVGLGASEITCVEARPENFLKVLAAKEALGWSSVRLVMDDFHNCRSTTYGRYDLVVAQGVYYHSVAPLLLLENLCSLADSLFVGGYCATDALPSGVPEILAHKSRSYRVKRYREVEHFMAGLNPDGFFLYAEDLLRFFHERGFETQVLSDEEKETTAGRYVRFLARRASSPLAPA